jgi:M6 family metalloprotease-like protein
MKKKILTSTLFVLSAFALAGCDLGDIYSYAVPSTSTTTTKTTSTTTTSEDVSATSTDSINTSLVTKDDGTGYAQKDISAYKVSNYPNLSALRETPLPSTGTQKILVVPVRFSNTTMTSAQVSAITAAYNGAASDTGWQSLRSFYQTSSYGKLTIDSTICDVYTSSYSTTSFQQYAVSHTTQDVDGATVATDMLASSILSTLASKYTLSDYDNNNDGYIDGFEMVYNAGSLVWDGESSSSTSVWWNYTSYSTSTSSASGEKVGLYFWSRIGQLQNGFYSPNIDAHTLIHETGHMLGLDDYYSYDDNEGPAGLCDMMDMNIGDHDAYSKMLLGWVKPKVVDGTSSNFAITLSSFTESGDCILLRNTTSDPWNGTPYDEYLLLQYYTPTGLNASDASGYKEWKSYGTGSLYKKAGLQVFHVDARLVTGSTWNTVAYTDSVKTGSNTFIAASNTGSYSINVSSSKSSGKEVTNSSYRLLKAIPALGSNIYSGSNYEDKLGYQNTLFGTSSYSESYATYTNSRVSALYPNKTKFNDGSTLNYAFEVTAQSDSSITVSFAKIA